MESIWYLLPLPNPFPETAPLKFSCTIFNTESLNCQKGYAKNSNPFLSKIFNLLLGTISFFSILMSEISCNFWCVLPWYCSLAPFLTSLIKSRLLSPPPPEVEKFAYADSFYVTRANKTLKRQIIFLQNRKSIF